MTQTDLFYEYLNLNSEISEIKHNGLEDIKLAELTILRITNTDYKIIYLYNGNSISISWNWINLFNAYNTYFGNRALNIGAKEENSLDMFIFEFLSLINFLNNSKYKDFFDCLEKIIELGTENFRNWIKTNFNIFLEPIKFRTINKIISI